MRCHWKALFALSALLGSICALGNATRAETLDELYAKARLEKTLVIYAGGPVTNYEPLAREFESKYPGITITITGGFSNVLNRKIEQQFKENKLEADMVLFQTAQDFVRWKSEGKMLAFKPDGFDAIAPSFRDPDGAFIVWYVGTLSYAYNTQHVKARAGAPKSALDFLKPEFRGKMIACYPHDDDATLYLFHTHRQEVRLGLHREIHGKPAQLGAGPPQRLALGRVREGSRHPRRDHVHHSQSQEGRTAGGVRILAGRSGADLLLDGRASSRMRRTPNVAKLYLSWLLRAGPAEPDRLVLAAPDVPRAGRIEAAVLLYGGQRVSGFPDQRGDDR